MRNRKINKLQQEYENIKIPEILENRMKEQIEKGKSSRIEENTLENSLLEQGEKVSFCNNDKIDKKKINQQKQNFNSNKDKVQRVKINFTNIKLQRSIKKTVQMASVAIIFLVILANSNMDMIRTIENIPMIEKIIRSTNSKEQIEDNKLLEQQEIGELESRIMEDRDVTSTDIFEKKMAMEQVQMEAPVEIPEEEAKIPSIKSKGDKKEKSDNYDRIISDESCYGGLVLETLFKEGSDYIKILSDYIKEELWKDLDEKTFDTEIVSEIQNYQIVGDEYIYINEEEDLVIVIQLEEIEKGQKEVVIPVEEIKDILKES